MSSTTVAVPFAVVLMFVGALAFAALAFSISESLGFALDLSDVTPRTHCVGYCRGLSRPERPEPLNPNPKFLAPKP